MIIIGIFLGAFLMLVTICIFLAGYEEKEVKQMKEELFPEFKDDISGSAGGIMSELTKLTTEIDEANFRFLAKHGYKIEKPYTVEKAIALKEQLDKDGMVFAYELEPTEFEKSDTEYSYRFKIKQQLRKKTKEDT